MNVMRTFAIAFITFAISGCALDISSNSNGRCSVSSPCQSPAAPVCYRGFCVAGDATVPPSDAGIDAAMVDGGADGGLDANADVGLDANADSGIDVGIDGGCDAGSTTCSTGLPGACATGRAACGNMCIPPMPMTERCGGGDLDCDGTIDEESNVRCYPAATMGCVRQADGSFRCAGACRTGTQTCSGGTLGLCSGAVTPAGAEQCTTAGGTAFDVDCDGTIDEGCSCTNAATQPCFPGAPSQAGVGVCRNGTQTCATMMWGACAASGMPSPETCMNQGADNDCDGIIDDIPGGGATCPIAAQMGVCAAGTMQCMGGSLACVGPTPVPEICNHLDDDCDGSVDESFAFASDGANCGGCGHACGTGSTCCNGVCVDESSNATHCGSCLMTCGGQSCCSSMCADTMNDRNNCGACGNVCSGSQLCCTGRCIDPLRDATNCATCGHACGGATSACCGGSCVAPTAPACTGCQVDADADASVLLQLVRRSHDRRAELRNVRPRVRCGAGVLRRLVLRRRRVALRRRVRGVHQRALLQRRVRADRHAPLPGVRRDLRERQRVLRRRLPGSHGEQHRLRHVRRRVHGRRAALHERPLLRHRPHVLRERVREREHRREQLRLVRAPLRARM